MKRKILIWILTMGLVLFSPLTVAFADEYESGSESVAVDSSRGEINMENPVNTENEETDIALFAEEENPVKTSANVTLSGECGSNLTWVLTDDWTLTISGKGEMDTEAGAGWDLYGWKIQKVIIEDGVTSIGNGAFSNCTSMTEISIPDSVISIGDSALSNCISLTEIEIPENVTYIGRYAFSSCDGLGEITIPEGVSRIEGGTFAGCINLKEAMIPDNVTSIERDAFRECSSLTEITIPGNVEGIGDYAFYYCTGLQKVTILNGVKSIGISAFLNCSSLTEITIPDSVINIERSAFCDCSSLTKAIIPSGMTDIKSYTFAGCSSLTDVTIPVSVTNIEQGAFDGTPWSEMAQDKNGFLIVNNLLVKCASDNLAITVPDTVESIEERAFYERKGLEHLSIPDNVFCIKDRAFENCTSLTDINIPNTVTSIQYAVFAGCESLTSVQIPSSVTTIEGYAFSGTGLTSMTIPKTVTSIEEYALGYNCVPVEGEYGHYNLVPIDGFTIYGYAGSAAEAYAIGNSFDFIELNNEGLAIVEDRTDKIYVRFSGTGAVIYCTGDFDKFVSVEMDGEVVDSQNYAVKEGSTVLTFVSSYLDTLATGRHLVTLNYIDGSISSYLTITEAKDAGTGNKVNSSGTGGGVAGTVNRAVRTGDDADITLWLILGFGSLIICKAVHKTRKGLE